MSHDVLRPSRPARGVGRPIGENAEVKPPARSSERIESVELCDPFRELGRRIQCYTYWTCSVQNRRQISAGRLVVQADGHERLLLDKPQAMVEAPAKHIVIASGQEKSGPAESGGGSN
jgi:hypothetical protein